MLLDVDIAKKELGGKDLIVGGGFSLERGQKIGLVGRNGTGKSTLINLIMGTDKDLDGEVSLAKNIRLVSTRQEHVGVGGATVIEYILDDLPEYGRLKRQMDSLSADPSEQQLERYGEALERFTVLDYFAAEERIRADLERLNFTEQMMDGVIKNLSGGQKRLVEVVKVMNSDADLALMDEPTNHMDYVAKQWFINWLKGFKGACIVVSHDRDVLTEVDMMMELKDLKLKIYEGGYEAYLKQNTFKTVNGIKDWENLQKRVENLKADRIKYKRMKEKARNPKTIKNFKRLEGQSADELAELQKIEKPSFWIDKESQTDLKSDMVGKYDSYKTKNIEVATNSEQAGGFQSLVDVDGLSLGYGDRPLFTELSFVLKPGERLEVRGRNGAGKTTLIKLLLSLANENKDLPSKVFTGVVELDPKLTIGFYEQELGDELLGLTLQEAIYGFYSDLDKNITETKLKALMSKYLFEPHRDGSMPVKNLSGGQKARLQLIKMLASDPNLLILDEPTNHLDLPSIEELESALNNYGGAILYISHDSYFRKNIGGKVTGL